MAVPFNLPAYENANINDMDQLLAQLYHILTQILLRRINVPVPNPPDGGGANPPEENQVPEPEGRLPLPDLVPEADNTIPAVRVRSSGAHNTIPGVRVRSSGASRPDVALDAERAQVRSGRHRRRRRRQNHLTTRTSTSDIKPEGDRRTLFWTQMGEALRRVADDFRASLADENRPNIKERREKSFFSRVPRFTGSILTAVVFLVGWRLLCRER